jgi:hypothetical protein
LVQYIDSQLSAGPYPVTGINGEGRQIVFCQAGRVAWNMQVLYKTIAIEPIKPFERADPQESISILQALVGVIVRKALLRRV